MRSSPAARIGQLHNSPTNLRHYVSVALFHPQHPRLPALRTFFVFCRKVHASTPIRSNMSIIVVCTRDAAPVFITTLALDRPLADLMALASEQPGVPPIRVWLGKLDESFVPAHSAAVIAHVADEYAGRANTYRVYVDLKKEEGAAAAALKTTAPVLLFFPHII
jgi:hypothetical protein